MLFVFFVPYSRTIAQSPALEPATAPAALNYPVPTVTLLPDSPFYKLQLIWDRLSLLMSTSIDKKISLYIKLSDRELTAADKLIEKGNSSMGVHSAFRGEHYMTMLVNQLKETSYETGKFDSTLANSAHQAFPYHQQVLAQMIAKTSGQDQSSLTTILEFSQRNDNELKLLEEEYTLPSSSQAPL